MHKENGACTRGEILSRLSLSYKSMATNADQWKWRQIRISSVSTSSDLTSAPYCAWKVNQGGKLLAVHLPCSWGFPLADRSFAWFFHQLIVIPRKRDRPKRMVTTATVQQVCLSVKRKEVAPPTKGRYPRWTHSNEWGSRFIRPHHNGCRSCISQFNFCNNWSVSRFPISWFPWSIRG